jgi:hypothetical protein
VKPSETRRLGPRLFDPQTSTEAAERLAEPNARRLAAP